MHEPRSPRGRCTQGYNTPGGATFPGPLSPRENQEHRVREIDDDKFMESYYFAKQAKPSRRRHWRGVGRKVTNQAPWKSPADSIYRGILSTVFFTIFMDGRVPPVWNRQIVTDAHHQPRCRWCRWCRHHHRCPDNHQHDRVARADGWKRRGAIESVHLPHRK